jgi:ABC-type dipeptide/oligopeptide/nickel transport system permease component
MLRFLLQRAAFSAVVLVGIVFIIYLGMGMSVNSDATEPDFDVFNYTSKAWQDTQSFFNGIAQGDWGFYVADSGVEQVGDILWPSFINSMGLLLLSLFGAVILGSLLGGITALRKGASLGTLTLTIIGISLPSFFVALLLQRAVIWHTQTFGRTFSVGGFGWDYQHMLLPVLVLFARPLAYLTRSSFLSLGHIMQEDFIRTAFAKGLRRFTVVNIHALKNIAIPVLTAIGVSLRFSLGTLPVVEFFFAWPGMGLQLINAINSRQTAVVVALAFIIGATLLSVNFMLDILYRLVDPRLQEKG